MTFISIQEAAQRLTDLIHGLSPGDELVITEDERPVALLTAAPPPRSKRKLGTLKGTVLYMAPDFDAPLKEFRDYMR